MMIRKRQEIKNLVKGSETITAHIESIGIYL
jgi:hypothetical protein